MLKNDYYPECKTAEWEEIKTIGKEHWGWRCSYCKIFVTEQEPICHICERKMINYVAN